MWLGFFERRRLVPLLHTPPFGFWFVMMNPGFIPSDDAIQEVITLTVADVLAVGLIPFCQMFGHPPCGTQECHALKNMPYLHWHLVVIQFLLLLHSLLMAWITALPSSCFSSVADVDGWKERLASIKFVGSFLKISIHSYTLMHGNVLSPYWAHKHIWISAHLTHSAHKSLENPLCSSAVQSERHTDMFMSPQHTDRGDQLQSRSDNQNTVYNAAKSH